MLDKSVVQSTMLNVCNELNPTAISPINSQRDYYTVTPEELEHFAQAIYEMGFTEGTLCKINEQTNYNRGVADERARCAKITDDLIEGKRCGIVIHEGWDALK